MTASAKPASNGSTTTVLAPERKTGMDHIREAEAYHLASLAYDATFEAERLCSQLARDASNTYLRSGSTDEPDLHDAATGPTHLIDEAARCLETAQHYLRCLTGDPPF